MGIVSEVFGRCVEEIDVYVEVECGDVWLCCELEYMRLVLAGKTAQCLPWRWEMVPGVGSHL